MKKYERLLRSENKRFEGELAKVQEMIEGKQEELKIRKKIADSQRETQIKEALDKKRSQKKKKKTDSKVKESRILRIFSSRGLQDLAATSSEMLLESDSSVLINKADPMFSSFDGAKGTTQQTENTHFRAMNASLSFL